MLRSASFFVQRFMLGRRSLLARVPEFDLVMRVPAGEAVGRHLFRDAMHAPEVIDFLATGLELAPDDVVFDIGASIGWYSLLLARIAPRGAEIHAFEPDPWTRGLLQENASRNRADAITVVGVAVGEDSGPASLHRSGQRRHGRLPLLPGQGTRPLRIDMVSLDDYCRRADIAGRPVGFMKIGVQGFEYFALRGALETLGRCRVVLTEFSPGRLEESGAHPAGLLDLLGELGFAPAVLGPAGRRPVARSELLGETAERHVLWERPRAHETPRTPDPDALAI
jgi:FkbM family methyltransferase